MKTNSIVIGPIGSGKSWAKRTLLREYPDENGKFRVGAGKDVYDLSLEPGWQATNGDLTCDMGYHIKEHLPADVSWEAMGQFLDLIGNLSHKQLMEFNVPPSIKRQYMQLLELVKICQNFTCDRCGKEFGSVDSWKDDVALTVDGLSGLTTMAVNYTVGPKPTLSWGEVDSTQQVIEGFIKKWVALECSFVLICHWAREPREVQGDTIITVDTVGKKLAPRILKPFDEIILAERSLDKYTWNTTDTRLDLKARRLPYAAGIEPTFAKILGYYGQGK